MSLLSKNRHYPISADLTAPSSSKLIFSIKLPEEIAKDLSSGQPEPLSLVFSTDKMGQLNYGSTKSWSCLVTNEAGPVDLLHRTDDHLIGIGPVQAKISVKNELEASKMLAIRSKSEQAEKDRRERKSIVLPEVVPKSQLTLSKKSVAPVHLASSLKRPISVSAQSAPASTVASPSASPSSLSTMVQSLSEQSNSQPNSSGLVVKRPLSTAAVVPSDTKPRNPVSLIHLPEAAKQKLKRLMGKGKKAKGSVLTSTTHRDKSSHAKSIPATSLTSGLVSSSTSTSTPTLASVSATTSSTSMPEPTSVSVAHKALHSTSTEPKDLSDPLLLRFKDTYHEYKSLYASLKENQALFNDLATRLQNARSAEDQQSMQQTIEAAYAERGPSHMAAEQQYRKLHFELLALKEQLLRGKD